jgi:hypothetical protein
MLARWPQHCLKQYAQNTSQPSSSMGGINVPERTRTLANAQMGAIREISESDCHLYPGSFNIARSRVIISLSLYITSCIVYQQKYWSWFQISMWQMSQGSTASSINVLNSLLYAFFQVIPRWHITFRRRGSTLKEACSVQNTAKVWNRELNLIVNVPYKKWNTENCVQSPVHTCNTVFKLVSTQTLQCGAVCVPAHKHKTCAVAYT